MDEDTNIVPVMDEGTNIVPVENGENLPSVREIVTNTGETLIEDGEGWFFINLKTLQKVGERVHIIRQTADLLVAQFKNGEYAFVSTNKENGDIIFDETATINGVEYGPITYCDNLGDKTIYFEQNGKFYVVNRLKKEGGLREYDKVEIDKDIYKLYKGDKVIKIEKDFEYVEKNETVSRSKKLVKQLKKGINKYNNGVDTGDNPGPKKVYEDKKEDVKRLVDESDEPTYIKAEAITACKKLGRILNSAVSANAIGEAVEIIDGLDDRLLYDTKFVKFVSVWLKQYNNKLTKAIENNLELVVNIKGKVGEFNKVKHSFDKRVEKYLLSEEIESGEYKTLIVRMSESIASAKDSLQSKIRENIENAKTKHRKNTQKRLLHKLNDNDATNDKDLNE